MNLEMTFIGFIAGCLAVFFNYCIGKPGSDNFSPNEIFSWYTIWFSSERLKKMGTYKLYRNQLFDAVNSANNSTQARATLKDFYKIIYQAAEPYFTWEKAFGMCVVCNGVWIALFTGIVFANNFFELIIIIVISHVTIRLLSKVL